MRQIPWDMPSSERQFYEGVAVKPPEERTPAEHVCKRYVDMCCDLIQTRDALIKRANDSEAQVEALQRERDGAWENRNHFAHWLNEIARLFWGNDKQCYSPEATFRMVEALQRENERLKRDDDIASRELQLMDRRERQHLDTIERLKAPVSDEEAEYLQAEAHDGWKWLQTALNEWIASRATQPAPQSTDVEAGVVLSASKQKDAK